ncbi:MAG: glutamyl-tRNA reductase [Bacteroidetes bacterium MED-G21]|nr:MAG: glutamyl-tRNA reductase [Bacteroidetes bacterium MED-G21]
MQRYLSETKSIFFSIGISHWKTPIDVREKFNFSESAIDAILKETKTLGVESLFVVSTCNRAQFFAHTHNAFILKELYIKHSRASEKEFEKYHFQLSGDDAVLHLFELCCGLDSLMLGDLQIVSQIKDAVKYASNKEMLDGYTHRLMQFVMQAYKDVRTDTAINEGPASVAHGAVLFIKQRYKSLKDKKIVLFGTGEIGETTAKNLLKHAHKEMVLINRTRSKAEAIANSLGLRVANIEDLEKELTNTDILIVATGAMEPTVYTKHFKGVENNMLLLDLSVPRNIEPGIEKLNGVELIDMDQLNNIQDETLAMRRKNIPKARTIINLHKNEFFDWVLMRDLSPVIQALHEKLHRYRTDEIEQQKFRLSDEEIKKANKLTTSVVNKIANQATEYIKSKYRHSEEVVKMMEEMFKLKQ